MMKHKKIISNIVFTIIVIIIAGIAPFSALTVGEFAEDDVYSPELQFWRFMFYTSTIIFIILGLVFVMILDIRKNKEEIKKKKEEYSRKQMIVYYIIIFLIFGGVLLFFIVSFVTGYSLVFDPNLRNNLFLEYFFNIGMIISQNMILIAIILMCIYFREKPLQEQKEFLTKIRKKVKHLFIIGFLMIGFVIILQVILLVRSPPVFILFIIETPVGLFFNLLLLLIGGILILIAIVKGMIITLRDYD